MTDSDEVPPFTRHTIGPALHAVGTVRHAGGYRKTVCGRYVGSVLKELPWSFACSKCCKAVDAWYSRVAGGPQIQRCPPSNGRLSIHPNQFGSRQRPNTVKWKF